MSLSKDSPIAFSVPGRPRPQPRPRAYVRGRRAGVYHPTDDFCAQYRRRIGRKALSLFGERDPLEGPVSLAIHFHFPRPKKHFYQRKSGPVIREDAPIFHTFKPDLDNLAKAVKDALTDSGVIKDDSQVVQAMLAKDWIIYGVGFTEIELIPIQ